MSVTIITKDISPPITLSSSQQRLSLSMIETDLGPRREKFVNDIKLLSRKTTLAKLCKHSKTESQSNTADPQYEVLTSCPPRDTPSCKTSSTKPSSSTNNIEHNNHGTKLSVDCPHLSPATSSHASCVSTDSCQLETPCSLSERIPFQTCHSRTLSVPVSPSFSRNLSLTKSDRTPKFLKRLKKLLKLGSHSSST